MKKLTAFALPLVRGAAVAALAVALTGCMSDKQWADTKEMHKELIRQQRTYRAVSVTGNNMSITLTGVTSVELEAPLNPITVMPQSPEGIREVADGLVRLGTVAGATYVGAKLADGATGNTTVNNTASP